MVCSFSEKSLWSWKGCGALLFSLKYSKDVLLHLSHHMKAWPGDSFHLSPLEALMRAWHQALDHYHAGIFLDC